jgi:hypothetical protein
VEEKGVENASTMRKQEFIHRIGIYVAWARRARPAFEL